MKKFFGPSLLILVFINLIPTYGIFVSNWEFPSIFLFYWIESILIGVVLMFRVMIIKGAQGDKRDFDDMIRNKEKMPGVIFSYLICVLGYGLLFISFNPKQFDFKPLVFPVVLLFIGYALELIAKLREDNRERVVDLEPDIVSAFTRAAVITITVTLGAFFVIPALDKPWPGFPRNVLWIMLISKVSVDLFSFIDLTQKNGNFPNDHRANPPGNVR